MQVDKDIIYPAFRLAKVTGGPQRTPSPDQVADAFQSLNRMVDQWEILRGMIYSIQRDEYPLPPGKTVYTIGPGGDIDAPRPARIEKANMIISTGPSAVYIPLAILDNDQWAALRIRQFPTTFPTQCYCDYNWPLANLYVWGTPTGTNRIELWTWQQAPNFAAATDTVSLPPAYLEAVVTNLAVRMVQQFAGQLHGPPDPNLVSDARRALAIIKAMNLPSPQIPSADYGTQSRGSRGDFDYLTGGLPAR